MKTFEVTKNATIVCRSENTRSGFRHLATLMIDGKEMDSAKCCYQNRTWERYEFQSVIHKLMNKTLYLSDQIRRNFKKREEKNQQEKLNQTMKTIGMIAQIGELMTDTKKDANDWKLRMIKAGLGDKGLSIPEDWDTLSEDEKESRLNKITAMMNQTEEVA